ncbi:hypothetical protein Taro_015828 [Colocasia esculenta]|uniref:Uncharacterized protein n=1 Tax=Colocasia esculenta TaxID=4460 RepID=A0A843UNJ4_COLES|nr:hypothetical protein [Colocasia esculenta]
MGRTYPKAEIVYDTSDAFVHRSRSRPTSIGWRNFMSPNLADMYAKASSSGSGNNVDSEDEDMDIKKILKDIEYLGSSNMSWKERKELENRKVVALGGKDMYLGRFQKKQPNERSEKRKNSEGGVLMASGGYFKKGVLDVKHLLKPSRPESDDHMSIANRKKKGKGKKRGGKKKRKH